MPSERLICQQCGEAVPVDEVVEPAEYAEIRDVDEQLDDQDLPVIDVDAVVEEIEAVEGWT